MAEVLVDDGKREMISALNTANPSHIGWGVGTGTASESNSALFDEVQSRVDGTTTVETTNVTDDTYQVVAELISDSTQTIEEVGLFTDTQANNGNLLVHADFEGVPLEADDKIEFTIEIVQTNV